MSLKHFKFDFYVNLINQSEDFDSDFESIEEMVQLYPDYSVEEIVCEWYNDLSESHSDDAKNIIFRYDKDRFIYTVDFDMEIADNLDTPECVFERLIDPDDDGNYPIKIDGVVYLVMGETEPFF